MELYFTKYPELANLLVRFTDPNHADFNQWQLMTEEETFIWEAQQYSGGAYSDPIFESLEDFAQVASPFRGLPPEDIVYRITQMIDAGVLEMR
jgi:hypothetical protein